jgi:uncharacterized protein (UPF0264 family)
MMFAVAGSLRIESLPQLVDVDAHILAVRTAACRRGERAGSICAKSVREFKAAITETFAPVQECVSAQTVNG